MSGYETGATIVKESGSGLYLLGVDFVFCLLSSAWFTSISRRFETTKAPAVITKKSTIWSNDQYCIFQGKREVPANNHNGRSRDLKYRNNVMKGFHHKKNKKFIHISFIF